MKKILVTLLIVAAMFSVYGCTAANTQVADPFKEASLEDILNGLYEGLSDDMPVLMQTEITSENAEWYLGTNEIDFQEGIASEPMMNAIAHSVCVLRMKEGADVEAAKNLISDKVNPDKWICVGVEKSNVIVDSAGSVIVLIMSNENAADIQANFKSMQGK